ncbi:MAG: SDR family oxidoreductase [Anaerolineae bacterium]|jgi:3-dehydrosphinganine reductase|nr:SDR family oxidoreductase [Anaerolineae bacterium]
MIFQDRIVLITGGSSGIGLATAQAFAREGAGVWLLARDSERLAAATRLVLDKCRCEDQKCGFVSCDLADHEQTKAAIESLVERAGLPDIVVHAAGIVRPGYFEELDLPVYRQMMEVNYFGAVHLIKAIAPGMMARRSGHIVAVASGAVLVPGFGYSAYAPSKHALRGLCDVLRIELKPRNVRVSIVYPPDTDTPQLAGEAPYKPFEAKRIYESTTVVSPEFVAGAILKGIRRGQYAIVPGMEMKAAALAVRWLGDWQFSVLDWLIARAQKSARST